MILRHHYKDVTDFIDRHLVTIEAVLLRKSNRLTTTIFKQFCCHHDTPPPYALSIYHDIYQVELFSFSPVLFFNLALILSNASSISTPRPAFASASPAAILWSNSVLVNVSTPSCRMPSLHTGSHISSSFMSVWIASSSSAYRACASTSSRYSAAPSAKNDSVLSGVTMPSFHISMIVI